VKGLGKSFAAGAVVLAAVPGAAWAQSSVTLYGIVDVGMAYTSNAGGHQQYALTSGVGSGSRFGMRGTEDLGGGNQALFVLENGFAPTTGKLGQNGTFFGRQAYVGMSGGWGTLTLGRTHSNTYDLVSPLVSGATWAASGAGYGTHPADLDNLNTTNRINNAIKYMSANYAGLQFGAMYSLGGVAGNFTRNQILSLAAAYQRGPVTLAAGYLDARDPNYSLWGDKAGDSTTASNITSPVLAGFATAGDERVITAAGAYAIGAATVGLVYSRTRFGDLGSVQVSGLTATENAYRGSTYFDSGEVNLKYQVSPVLLLGVAYAYTRGGDVESRGDAYYQQVNLGMDYLFSKRTDVYAITVLQKAGGVNSTGQAAVAAINGATASSTDRQLVAAVGLRHRF
jgi:predicted porin